MSISVLGVVNACIIFLDTYVVLGEIDLHLRLDAVQIFVYLWDKVA